MHIKGLVRLSLLQQTDPLLLVRFLDPYKEYLNERSIKLSEATADPKWIRRLYVVLTAADDEMPSQLVQALLDIADVASASGQEIALALSKEKQLNLFEKEQITGPEDTAFTLYIEDRELFRDSHTQVRSKEARKYVNFLGPTGSVLEKIRSRRLIMIRSLREWFKQCNRTDYVDITYSATKEETTFTIIHGRQPRSVGVIHEEKGRDRKNIIFTKEDIIIVHYESGRLSINAQYPNEKDKYRRLIGEVFFDDDSYFKATSMIVGSPLLDYPSETLSIAGFQEIESVKLRHLSISNIIDPSEKQTFQKSDLLPRLLHGNIQACMANGEFEVTYFELVFKFIAGRHPVIVKAATPNRLEYDRRCFDNQIREFLLAKGLMVLSDRLLLEEAI